MSGYKKRKNVGRHKFQKLLKKYSKLAGFLKSDGILQLNEKYSALYEKYIEKKEWNEAKKLFNFFQSWRARVRRSNSIKN